MKKIISLILVLSIALSLMAGIGISSNAANYIFPVLGNYSISSPYGSRKGGYHYGIDIATGGKANAVVATAAGTVVRVANSCGHVSCGYKCEHYSTYGNLVAIRHSDGKCSYYGHLQRNSITVKVGENVSAGQQIANVGSSGYSTGYHLHFEIRTSYGASRSTSTCLNVNPSSMAYTHLNAPAPTVVVNPTISANKSSIALGINSNTSTSITLNCTGSFSLISSSWPDCVSLSGQGWNGGSYTYAVYAKKVGSGTLKFDLKNASGQIVASTSVSISVQGASVSASATSVELYKDGTNTKSVNLTAVGNLPPHYKMKYSVLNGKCRCEWGKWNNQTIPLVITGVNYGTDRISISLINSETNAVVATKTINVNVTSQDYTVNFDANGGTGGPSKITHKYRETFEIPAISPTINESHTVTFDANGGTLSETKTVYKKVFDYWYDNEGNHYTKNSTYIIDKNITLYAHYSFERLYAKNPTKPNSYFVGWYDSKPEPNGEEPIGNLYTQSSEISKDITLYAAWSNSKAILFGDLNFDGKISLSDVSKLNKYAKGKIELNPTEVFFGDINCDGKITVATDSDGNVDYSLDGDVNILFNYVRGKINYEDLPIVKLYSGVSIKSLPKTKYSYGEQFNSTGLVLQTNYTNNATIHHYFSNDYVISGYDPYKIGKQTVTINYYQWTVSLEVEVEPPTYVLNFDATGGILPVSSSKQVQYYSTFGELSIPERTGYRFLGWFTEPNGGTQVGASTVFNQMNDITVYAHWQKQQFTVTFDCTNLSKQIEAIRNVEYETNVTIPSTVLSKKGFTFKGWSIVSNSNSENHIYPGDKVLITENTVLYPVWESANEIKEGEFFEYRTEFDNYNKVIKFNPNTSSIFDIQIESQSGIDISVMTGSIKTKDIRKFDSNGFTNVSYYLIAGKTYYLYLSGLDKDESVLIDINEALEHDHKYINSVEKPMATTLGYTRHKCEYCNESYQDTYTAPTGKLTLKHSARTANAVKVQWNNVKTATGYQVQISNAAGNKWVKTITCKPNVNAYVFGKLAAGNNYKFRVRFYIKAVDGKNYFSPWSATLNSPTLPKGTALKLTTAKKAFTAKWTKIGGVTGYQVQYATNAKFSKAVTKTVKGASKYSLAVKSLKGGAKYYVRIRTYKIIGGKNYFSTWSAAKAVTTKK